MKKKFYFTIIITLFYNGLQAQDTIPFWNTFFNYPIVCAWNSDIEIPWDSLQHVETTLTFINGRWQPISFKHRAPYGTNIYGVAVTSNNPDILPLVKGEIYTYNNGHFIYYDSVCSSIPLYHKQMFFDYNNIIDHNPIDDRIVPCNIYLFNNKATIEDSIFYFKMQSENSNYSFWSYSFTYGNLNFATAPMEEGLQLRSGFMYPLLSLPCPAPRRVNVGTNYSGRVEFHWNPGGDTALYQLSFYSADDGRLMFETDTLTDTNFVLVDSMVPADMVNGRYEVRARKACDYLDSPYHTLAWSEWSEPRAFNYTHRVEGIGEVEEAMQFTLSPNPASGTVTVEIDREGLQGTFLQIVNLKGHIVAESIVKGPMFDLDISALPTGVYMVLLNTPEGVSVRRLVVK